MTDLTIAAGTRIAADAGIAVAREGGNAVDAALAAMVVSMCTDTGIMSPGAGGFVTVWPGDGEPVVIDGFAEMPGRGLAADRFGESVWEVVFDYGGETRQRIGYGSVATPGAFAGLALASERFGRLPWSRLLQPAIEWVEQGFPLTGGAAEFLAFTHEAIYTWHADSNRILHRDDGSPLQEGDMVHVPGLADSLRLIAEEGAGTLYGGSLGQTIANGVLANGGRLSLADLKSYRPVVREPVWAHLADWSVATNPPPAVGGACLAAMLLVLDRLGAGSSAAAAAHNLVTAQHAALDYRAQRLDGARENLADEVERLLDLAHAGAPELLEAPSTSHVSAVDADGLACAVTASAGYGSGAMVEGTGFWLNNSLGEIDLHTKGLTGVAPGARLASNMAPSVARREDGAVIAIGSPGASRITTAIAQVLWNFAARGMPISDAVMYPRLHVELFPQQRNIAYEPDLPVVPMAGLSPRPFAKRSMYFGGVQAALWTPDKGLQSVADARRGGSVANWVE